MRFTGQVWVIGVLIVAACGGDDQGQTDSSSTTTLAEPTATSTTQLAPTSTGQDRTTTSAPVAMVDLAVAERFIDAFYSFNAGSLVAVMDSAGPSQAFIVFYQGWAQRANYQIVDRQPCTETRPNTVECSVTVEDDFATTLDFGFNVTDTFRLTFEDQAIVAVETTSDDPPIMQEAFGWMFQNKPELFEEGGVCEGFFDGGPTPGECATAFVAGLQEFVDSTP